MAGRVLERGTVSEVASTTAVGSRFGKYGPEEERAIRVPHIKENKKLSQLLEAWKRYRYEHDTFSTWRNVTRPDTSRTYGDALSIVRQLDYSAEDIENFSVALSELQDENLVCEKSGIFLSALINNSPESSFLVHARHLSAELWFLGFKNIKEIRVNGGCGDHLGSFMKRGGIEVLGNTGSRTGEWMGGGLIIVNGAAGSDAGLAMSGGKIVIEEFAGPGVGYQMQGGEIIIRSGRIKVK